MESQGKNLTKLCSFYVSDWHLVTMLLPYINQKINEQAKIATILEKNIKSNVTTLVEKLNLKNKEKILNLNWKKNEKLNINELKQNQDVIIFVNGTEKFIEKKNNKLEIYDKLHSLKNKIKIVNCYEITNYKGSITEILDKHDKILNTSGEREISEIFENYKKQEKKAV